MEHLANIREGRRDEKLPAALGAGVLAVLVWSMIQPADWPTWVLETFPVFVAAGTLAATYRRFPLTPLAYTLIALHCVILIVGGHYTYSEVPLGNWARDAFHLSRNHYDRLGHFAQGFVPALVTREVLVRHGVVARRGWRTFIILAICTAISAVYELLEWASAVIGGSGATAFLGTQGDPWDTQEDMAMCIVGAVASLLLLGRLHDRQLRRV